MRNLLQRARTEIHPSKKMFRKKDFNCSGSLINYFFGSFYCFSYSAFFQYICLFVLFVVFSIFVLFFEVFVLYTQFYLIFFISLNFCLFAYLFFFSVILLFLCFQYSQVIIFYLVLSWKFFLREMRRSTVVNRLMVFKLAVHTM